MLRRFFFSVLFTAAAAATTRAQTVDDEQVRQWLDLHHIWFVFLAKYFGCPKDQTQFEINECRNARGNMDYSSFNKARELAKKIFELEEKRGH